MENGTFAYIVQMVQGIMPLTRSPRQRAFNHSYKEPRALALDPLFFLLYIEAHV